MDAGWLTGKRVTAYSRLIVALYGVAIVAVLALSPGFIDPTGKPVGTDFLGFWSAGRMALDGRAADAYDYERHFAEEQKALAWKDGQQAPFLPWLYPPPFLMVIAAFAMAPYGVALGLWLLATLPMYLAAIRGILAGANVMVAALAFPAVLLNVAHGQTGFLTAGLLGGALLLLDSRPWISGVLFGLLAYKPQFGVLIPIALLAGGYWRTICAAGLTIAATVAGSWAVLGVAPWLAFAASLNAMGSTGLEHGSEGLEKLQSVFAAVRMWGGAVEIAWVAQAMFVVLGAAAVIWIWHKPGAADLKGAGLATATLMSTPYVFDYDLTILALPIAWLAAKGLREGFLRWEKTMLLAAWLLPLLSRTIGKYLHVAPAPLVITLLLALILRRAATRGRSIPLEPLPPLRRA